MTFGGALQLDGHSLILPRPGVLYVFGRRGAFDLRGKNVEALHARIAPHLQGTHSEDALLAAVPPANAGALRAYLARLRQAGVLRTLAPPEKPGETLPASALGPGAPRGRFLWRGQAVEVSLDGPLAGPRPAGASLEFLRPGEAGDWLLALGAPRNPPGCRLCVVEEPALENLSVADLKRRADYARWLLGAGTDLSADPERGESARVYELSAATGELRRLAEIGRDRPEHSLATLPQQVGLIRGDDVAQLPLSVVAASHRFFAPAARHAGLDHATVSGQALRDFLVRADLAEAAQQGGRVAFFRGEPGSSLARGLRLDLPVSAVLGLPVAATREELETVLLERLSAHLAEEGTTSVPETAEVDLLASSGGSPAVRCLREILRPRLGRLPARWTETAEGAAIVQAAGHRAVSFAPEKAVAEVLLAVVWDRFYGLAGAGGEAPRPALGYGGLAGRQDLRRRAAAQRKALRGRPERFNVAVRAVRRWGVTAWTGGWVAGD